MMTTAPVEIGTLIVQSPDIRDGRPRIAGTGVTVQRIVSWYKLGLTPEEIVAEIENLSLAQVHAALAYYHANRDETESALAHDKAVAREQQPNDEDPIRALRGRGRGEGLLEKLLTSRRNDRKRDP